MRKSFLLTLILGIATHIFSQTTIFQSSDTPANPSTNDNSGSITTGVKFRSSQAGYITGIRYYKGSGTTGTRSGHLFTSGGTLLASVTFSGETSSGWQQMAFSTPVSISASTTYIASCYSSSGDYAYDAGYFASSGVTNGYLTALQNGTDGSNGLYDYSISASTAPGSSYGGANYWVDVVFDNTPPTVSSVTPTNSATGISIGTTVTATFSEAVSSSTVTTSTFQLKDPGNNVITATVNTSSNVITLTPSSPLAYSTTYTATITGGGSGVKDLAGNALASNYSWSFTTTSSPPWVLAGNTGTNPPTDFLGTTDSTALVFKAFNFERMRITPNQPITIPYNVGGAQLKISHAGYGTGGIEINSNDSTLKTWLDAGSAIIRNGGAGIYMDAIGRISPANNDIYFAAYNNLENIRSSMYGGIIINDKSSQYIGLRVKGDSDPDLLITDADSNYVAIGTSNSPNPSDTNLKLAVNGNIYAKKLKVTQTDWSDYVFYPQYKLPTLKEVEEFIQKNKHLPDVPSAAEVESKGLDVGDNQAILLKKIEELTLYMIEVNKKVDKLSEENKILKRKLEIRKR